LNNLLPLIAFSILLLVPVGAQNAFAVPIFTDWTNINLGTDVATGTIGPIGVTMSGLDIDQGITDGSSTVFNDATFTPTLVNSDLVGFRANSPQTFSYTITFSSPVTDPVLHIGSLASTLTLSSPDAFSISKLSGDTGFDVDNALKTISGELDDSRPGGGTDRQGTAQMTGTISSFSFTADYDTFPGSPSLPEDGIFFQLGAMPIESEKNQVVAGEIIPIDATSLLLAGAQSFSWMIPVVLSVLGIGLFLVGRKNE